MKSMQKFILSGSVYSLRRRRLRLRFRCNQSTTAGCKRLTCIVDSSVVVEFCCDFIFLFILFFKANFSTTDQLFDMDQSFFFSISVHTDFVCKYSYLHTIWYKGQPSQRAVYIFKKKNRKTCQRAWYDKRCLHFAYLAKREKKIFICYRHKYKYQLHILSHPVVSKKSLLKIPRWYRTIVRSIFNAARSLI